MADEGDTIAMVKIVDAALRLIAEQTAGRANVSVDEAHESTWRLLEVGLLQLVGHADRLGVEPCVSRNERRLAAKRNRRLIEYRNQQLAKGTLGPGP